MDRHPNRPAEIPPDIAEAWDRALPRLGPFARRLRWFSTVGSTNDIALGLADDGAAEGTTIAADTQTAGRGRRGREWFSPPGAGLYVSVVLRPEVRRLPMPAEPATPRITLAAGVALAEGVRASTGLPAELKWPNDLVSTRRKLAGILAETSGDAGDGSAVVVGIGINVRHTPFPSALAATATSIETELGRPVDRALVLVETLAALAARYEDLRTGRFDAILTAWRGYAPSLAGAAVEWDGPHGVVRGHAVDVGPDGALLVSSDGALRKADRGRGQMDAVTQTGNGGAGDGLLLAIDVGNTNVVLGVFEGDELKVSWRLATTPERTADELGVWVTQFFAHRHVDTGRVAHVVMASVVPPLTRTVCVMTARYFGLSAARRGWRYRDRHAHPLREPGRGGRRPHRQRCRRVRAVRP